MAHAIEMFFDEPADAAVRRLWHRLAESGLSSLETYSHLRHRPHVSLTVGSNLDVRDTAVLADIAAVVAAGPLPRLHLPALATFAGNRGILFLAAVATGPLLALHERVNDVLQAHGVDQWPHYLPGRWVPHCTLAMDLTQADLSSAVRLLSGFEPFDAQVIESGITDSTTGYITPLGRQGSVDSGQ